MQHALAPNKPWFLYYATGTAHAPHHAPKDWIAKYKGQFDQGWDKVREETLARQKKLGVVPANTQLTRRPEQIPAWDSLSADQKRLYAHMMEVYAGALSYADNQIGRVVDTVRDSGQIDNTLVFFLMGDNGASAEGTLQGTTSEPAIISGVTERMPYLLSMIDQLGGPLTYNHYPVGWAHAMDSPMQWTKQVASHFGGTRNGMVISWPARIRDKGGLRSQFCHVIDIAPTIYEAAGIKPPTFFKLG
jgi:arylsulfatase A-like enzyme